MTRKAVLMFCTEFTLVNRSEAIAVAKPLRCNRWTCDHCYDVRRRQLQRTALDGQPDAFLTLTVDTGAWTSPEEAAQRLVYAWRQVRRRAHAEATRDPARHPVPQGPQPQDGWPRNDQGQVPPQVRLRNDKLHFLAVFETTDAGWPHLHILCRVAWLDQRWLSLQMADLMQSPVCDIRRIAGKKRAVGYVAKYVGKSPEPWPGCKRYWKSQGYVIEDSQDDSEEQDKRGGWEVQRVHFLDFWREMESHPGFLGQKGDEIYWVIREPQSWAQEEKRRLAPP